ncbi:MAG: ArsR/SmtB family transcription factor, partial [Stellaceae bacterium]
MTEGPLLAELGAVVGDRARASMLAALMDGRALTAGELAYAARVTPQTASAHLAKLAETRLVISFKSGRHHYVRLASPEAAGLVESLMAFALDGRPRFRPLTREAAVLRAARLCYDHFAGRLGVALAGALERQG